MDKRFFAVLRNNIECAFCEETNCPFRYEPNHSIKINGLWHRCKKEYEKRLNKTSGNK